MLTFLFYNDLAIKLHQELENDMLIYVHKYAVKTTWKVQNIYKKFIIIIMTAIIIIIIIIKQSNKSHTHGQNGSIEECCYYLQF